MGGVSALVGGIVIFILLSFTIDITIRAVKLGVLRIIAPVPIVSYMDAKSAKDGGAFQTWLKKLVSTYGDLFVRLLIIYLAVFIVTSITSGDVELADSGNGIVNGFVTTFVIVGIFYFAKEAPMFIKDVLGIKSDGSTFGGIGRILAPLAIAGGVAGSMRTNFLASKEENAQLHPGQTARNFARNMASSLAGGVGGLFAGSKAMVTAKDHQASAAIRAMQQRNLTRASHSTLPGRIENSAMSILGGRSASQRDENILKASQTASTNLKNLKSILEDETKKNGDYGEVRARAHYTMPNGTHGTMTSNFHFNHERLAAAIAHADPSGKFNYVDEVSHQNYVFDAADFDSNVMNDVLKTQAVRYQSGNTRTGGTSYADNGKVQTQMQQAQYAASQASVSFDGTYGDIGKAVGRANQKVADMEASMRHVMNRANQQANQNKH